MAAGLRVAAAAMAVACAAALVPNPMPNAVSDFPVATIGNASYAFYDDSMGVYSAATGEWKSVVVEVDQPTGAATAVGSKVIILGGGGQTPVATVTLLDTTTMKVMPGSPMPNARGWPGVAAVDGTVYALGGYAPAGWGLVDAYNVATDTWTSGLPGLPTPRYGVQAVAMGRKIYTIGGVGWHLPAADQVEVFDTESLTWSSMTPKPLPVGYFAAASFRGSIYCFGGNDGGSNIPNVEVYDVATDTWTEGTPLPKPYRSHEAAAAFDNYMIVMGGTTGKGLSTHNLNNVNAYLPGEAH